jgi:sporulation protein YabP
MEENKIKKSTCHGLILNNRKRLSISGICEIGAFDDKHISIFMEECTLDVAGSEMKIGKLSSETGELEISGTISSLVYSDNNKKNFIKKSFFNFFK